jgi:hypothetical protein
MTNNPFERPKHQIGLLPSARDVRQGDIVLRQPIFRKTWERRVFIAGLVGAIVLGLVLVLVGVHFGQAYSEQHANGPPTQVGMSKG